MKWTNAEGVEFDGQTGFTFTNAAEETIFIRDMIKPLSTDEDQAAFPRGVLRWTNIGNFEGKDFDLKVTVPSEPSFYSHSLNMQYVSPQTSTGTQAALTAGGYACLGLAVNPATCEGGGSPAYESAFCPSGEMTIMQGVPPTPPLPASHGSGFAGRGRDNSQPPTAQNDSSAIAR